MVLHKGDAERGALLLVISERGAHRALLERRLMGASGYGWARVGPSEGESAQAAQYVARARQSDPDCWVVELDVPSAERFIAETIASA